MPLTLQHRPNSSTVTMRWEDRHRLDRSRRRRCIRGS